MTIKQVAPDGSFEGLLAVYNNLDLGGDLIEPGAFTKTIQEHGDQVPLLWQHKTDRPIGMLTLVDAPDALRVQGQLLMDLPDARNAYLLIKARIVKGLSIGFDVVKDAAEGTMRRLKEIRLWEGSIVTFPMNEQALITSVKARKESKADFSTELAELQLQDAAYQMWIALRAALCSIPWSDLTRDEKVAASEASIDQFKVTYMAFIPAYIDYLTEQYGEYNSTYGHAPAETKAGRKISAATKKQISEAHEHVKSAQDLLIALIDDEADDDEEDDDTSEEKAALKTKPEPEIDHSAAQTLITSIRSLIPAA
jgi:HK97 family phage prohead protease